jgi:putative hemolysin
VMYYEIGLMFGCASLPGVDPARHALPLSYLYHHHLAPAELRPRALPERYVDMRMIEPGAIDQKAATGGNAPLAKRMR